MTNKHCFLLAGIMIFIGLTGISCSANITSVVSATFTPLPATGISATPLIAPSPTFLPLLAPTYSTAIPYPTAKAVQANAVAFIATDLENNSSLWIANVDGSGERKLVDNIGEWSNTTNFFLRWSPDGKRISYISNNELWMVSPDSSDEGKILLASDKSKRLISYNWAPDSSQVAYVQVSLQDTKFYSEAVRILNLETGETYELSSYKPQPYGTILRWSPNGQYLVFNQGTSFVVFDIANRKIKKEILSDNTGCSSEDNTGPVWSPNSEWFFHMHGIPVGYAFFWICVSGLDGSNDRVDIDGTIYSDVVWDKSGNFLYFVARKIDPHGDPNLDSDQRLQRYDVRTQKLERLLSLGQKYQSAWSVSISPDGRTLETHTQISENQQSYILMDLKSLSIIKKFILEFGCVWSANSENFVCLSQSNGYSVFYKLNIQADETTIFSGEHAIVSWAVSPIATSP